jgi:hypothetical protein
MLIPIHQSILNSPNSNKTAVVISPRFVAAAVLDQISDMLQNSYRTTDINDKTKRVEVSTGVDEVSFILTDASDIPPSRQEDNSVELVVINNDEGNGKIYLHSPYTIEITGWFIKKNTNEKLSKIHVLIPYVLFNVDLSTDGIQLNKMKFEPECTISLVVDRQQNTEISDAGWEKLSTLERWITLFGVQAFIRQFLEPSFDLDFNRLLPSLSLTKPLVVEIHEKQLVVFPDKLDTVRTNIICPNYDATTGSQLGTVISQTDRQTGSATWDIDISNLPTSATGNIEPARSHNQNGVQLFLPESTVDATFKHAFPSISAPIKGRGLLRYDGDLTIKLQNVKVTPSQDKLGIETYLEIGAHSSINFNGKIECVGTVDLGWGRTKTVEPLKLWLLTRFVYENGELVGKTTLRSLKVGKFETKIELFLKWLGFFGTKGRIIGWFLDQIVAGKISYEATLSSRKAVKKAFNQNNFTLIDLGSVQQNLEPYITGSFSSDGKTILMGIGSGG